MSDQNQALAIQTGGMFAVAPSSIFDNLDRLNQYEKMAEALAASSFIPEAFQKKPAECLIALEYAANLGMRPLMVMQNLHVVKGKPSWDGKFIGSVIKACGRFKNMRYVTGQDGVIEKAWVQGAFDNAGRNVENVPNLTCYVSVLDAQTGDEIKGTLVSIRMAVNEGWYGNKGSKWPNMPEQMLQYRAASFFGRIHVQDILLGMHTNDEVADMQPSYPDSGTGAVEIMPGVESGTGRTRQRRQGAAAPAPVVNIPTAEVPGYETMYPEVLESEEEKAGREAATNAVPFMTPVATPAPAPVVQPAPAVEVPVQAAPVAPAAIPNPEPGPYEFTADTMRVLVKLTKDPVVGNLSEPEAALLKAFGAAFPNLVAIPRTRRGKVEFTQDGNEWLAEQDLPEDMGEPADSGSLGNDVDLEVAVEAHTTQAGDVAPAPVMTAQPGGAAPTQAEANLAARNATAAQQYGSTNGNASNMLGPDALGKFHAAGSPGALAAWPLTGNPVKEAAARESAANVPTPLADAVPDPMAGNDSVADLFDLPA